MQWRMTVGNDGIAHDAPWLWYRLVARAKTPLWFPSLLLFIVLYTVGIVGATLAGEFPKFVRDIRWLAPLGLPALNSLVMSYTPQFLDHWWDSLTPWLCNTDEEIQALREAAPRLVTRFFWPMAIVLTVLVGQYVFVSTPGNWTQDYHHPQFLGAVTFIAAPFVGYFIGGASSMATVGLLTLLHRMGQALQFRRSFILEGGKNVLQPFNRLLWLIWSVILLTLLLVLVASTAHSPMALGNILTTAITIVVAVGSIALPQISMNRLLRIVKERELRVLQDELNHVATLPEHTDADEGIRRLLRHEHLVYQLQRTEAFAPTLIDYRFALQILLSFTAIILANVVLRGPLATWLH